MGRFASCSVSSAIGLREPMGAQSLGGLFPYIVGLVLSLVVALFARRVGLDRDRAFYPTVLIVIGLIYVLFAAMTGSIRTVLLESIVATGFLIVAVVGFRSSAWFVVIGLAAHGVMDAFHGNIVENSAVPSWWPAFCLAYDVGAAGGLALVLRQRGHR